MTLPQIQRHSRFALINSMHLLFRSSGARMGGTAMAESLWQQRLITTNQDIHALGRTCRLFATWVSVQYLTRGQNF